MTDVAVRLRPPDEWLSSWIIDIRDLETGRLLAWLPQLDSVRLRSQTVARAAARRAARERGWAIRRWS